MSSDAASIQSLSPYFSSCMDPIDAHNRFEIIATAYNKDA